jgi:Ca-activated chloride channel family protein
MEFRFHPASLSWLHLIWVAPALAAIFAWGFHRRRAALEVFARSEILGHLVASVDRGRQIWRAAFMVAGVALVALSIARPQWGTEAQAISRRGIDLVVLLDLSKSMLAPDVQPSRIERAKADLLELLEAVQGDRVGLVAFAGRAELRCPLTFDYGFFRHVLGQLEVGSVALGGTHIADAIFKGLDCYRDDFPNHKAILLITDGEDNEGLVDDAIEKARQRGVKIFAVGIGDANEGRRIPVLGPNGERLYLQDRSGQEVWTKLNPVLLQKAAKLTGGAYVAAGTGAVNLLTIYDEHIGALEKKELESLKQDHYKDRYQWVLGLGLLCLVIEPLVHTRRLRREERP